MEKGIATQGPVTVSPPFSAQHKHCNTPYLLQKENLVPGLLPEPSLLLCLAQSQSLTCSLAQPDLGSQPWQPFQQHFPTHSVNLLLPWCCKFALLAPQTGKVRESCLAQPSLTSFPLPSFPWKASLGCIIKPCIFSSTVEFLAQCVQSLREQHGLNSTWKHNCIPTASQYSPKPGNEYPLQQLKRHNYIIRKAGKGAKHWPLFLA